MKLCGSDNHYTMAPRNYEGWGIFIVTNYCLMGDKAASYIHYSVAEDSNFLVNISIEKGSIPIKVSNCPSDKFSTCLLIMPDLSWVW